MKGNDVASYIIKIGFTICVTLKINKQLCGSSKIANKDLQTSLHPDLKFEDQELCEQINKTLENFTPLSGNVKVSLENDSPVN